MELEEIQRFVGLQPGIDRHSGEDALTFNAPNCHFVKLQHCIFHKNYSWNSWIKCCATDTSITANKHCQSRDQGPILQFENVSNGKTNANRLLWTVYVQMYSHTAVINRYVILLNVLIAFRCFFIYFLIIRLVLYADF